MFCNFSFDSENLFRCKALKKFMTFLWREDLHFEIIKKNVPSFSTEWSKKNPIHMTQTKKGDVVSISMFILIPFEDFVF